MVSYVRVKLGKNKFSTHENFDLFYRSLRFSSIRDFRNPFLYFLYLYNLQSSVGEISALYYVLAYTLHTHQVLYINMSACMI